MPCILVIVVIAALPLLPLLLLLLFLLLVVAECTLVSCGNLLAAAAAAATMRHCGDVASPRLVMQIRFGSDFYI